VRAGTRLLLAAALLPALSGCAAGPSWESLLAQPSPPAAPSQAATQQPVRPADPGLSALIATLPRTTEVLSRPDGGVLAVQASRTEKGSPQSLLVLQQRGGWLRVALPGRPHGRSGWVRAAAVEVSATDWRLEVSLSQRRLTVSRGGLVYGEHPVAVGAASTPTPTGLFFVTDLLRPPQSGGAYGPYAFGLSAFSDVVTSFGGGRGQIGLHGTNAPASIGTAASSGCLRIDNDTVTALAEQLPLGTPVEIRA
jgi:lipoprotein-anchoring transpeptidase ErfK/SrfK